MTDLLQEPRCSESGPPESHTLTMTDLCQRVAALEVRLAPRIKPKANPGQRRGRRDRVPFGWKVDRRDDHKLVPDWDEQETIRHVQAARA
jgi:hypothetical protein